HAVAADAAGREIREAAVLEPDSHVGDVHAARQDWHADGVDRLHIRIDQRQHDVEIVNHQVEHDVDVQAPLGEDAQTVHFDEPRIGDQGARHGDRGIEPLGV